MYTELTEDNLEQLLQSNPKVMVQFGASWCGNCKITKPKFKHLAEEHSDLLFVYADAEKFPGSRKFADVSNLPTFAAFSGSQLSKQLQGNKIEVIKEVLDALISH
jgi:thiol-disulfide isomerase/thioredoxin